MKGVLIDENFTNSQSEFIRTLFYENSTVPPQILSQITQKIQSVFGSNGNMTVARYLKFRSSSNTEDVPGFDGAGLYDSYKIDMQAKDKAREKKRHRRRNFLPRYSFATFLIAWLFVCSYGRRCKGKDEAADGELRTEGSLCVAVERESSNGSEEEWREMNEREEKYTKLNSSLA